MEADENERLSCELRQEARLRTTAEESAFEAQEEAQRLRKELRVRIGENKKLTSSAADAKAAVEEAERLQEQLDKKIQEADCLSSKLEGGAGGKESRKQGAGERTEGDHGHPRVCQ